VLTNGKWRGIINKRSREAATKAAVSESEKALCKLNSTKKEIGTLRFLLRFESTFRTQEFRSQIEL